MKKILFLFILGALLFSGIPGVEAQTGNNGSPLDFLYQIGVTKKLEPKKTIKQTDFLKMVIFSKGKKIKTSSIPAYKAQKPLTGEMALNILGTIEKWPKPYTKYAKEKKILDPGKKFFPKKILTREQAAEFIYNTYFSKTNISKNPEPKTSQETTNTAKKETDLLEDSVLTIPDPPQGGVNSSSMGANFFEKIQLKEGFPTIFYENEIYVFYGSVQTEDNEVTAFITYDDETGKSYFQNFTAPVKEKKFEIPITFSKKGKYFLGMVPGKTGSSKVVQIGVESIPAVPSVNSTENDEIKNISLGFKNDTVIASWPKNASSMQKITFEQDGLQKTFYSRQKRTSIPINRKPFKDFSQGSIQINLEEILTSSNFPLTINGLWTKTGTGTAEIIRHIPSRIEKTDIAAGEIPEILPEPKTVTFSGTAKINIQKKAAVRKPDGFVEEFDLEGDKFGNYFKTPIIVKDSNYAFSYTPKTKGAYQIEINNEGGAAVLNIPVYIGNAIPLLPDYFELYDQSEYPELKLNLTEFRKTMVDTINAVRKKHGLNVVILREDLNTLSQVHADDMVKRKFFAHVNPDNESPQDRRKKLNITTPVGENLAQSISVIHAMEGLMNSPIHRSNILDPKWTTLGLGFAIDDKNTLFTVQEFSTAPLTEEDLQKIENDLWSLIKQKRQEAGIAPLIMEDALTEIAEKWSNELIKMDQLDFVAPNGNSLQKLIQEKKITREVSIFLSETNTTENFIDYIVQNSPAIEQKWAGIGFDISLTAMGDLKFTMILVK